MLGHRTRAPAPARHRAVPWRLSRGRERSPLGVLLGAVGLAVTVRRLARRCGDDDDAAAPGSPRRRRRRGGARPRSRPEDVLDLSQSLNPVAPDPVPVLAPPPRVGAPLPRCQAGHGGTGRGHGGRRAAPAAHQRRGRGDPTWWARRWAAGWSSPSSRCIPRRGGPAVALEPAQPERAPGRLRRPRRGVGRGFLLRSPPDSGPGATPTPWWWVRSPSSWRAPGSASGTSSLPTAR